MFAFHVQGLAPRAALGILAERLRDGENKRKWSAEARAMAVLGSCPHTLQSLQSGWNNYLNYCEIALGSREAGLPPTVDLFLGWSHTHRCVGTFSNYVGHVASACLARGIDCPSTTHPAVVRAKHAIAKRLLFVSAEQGFIKQRSGERMGNRSFRYAVSVLLRFSLAGAVRGVASRSVLPGLRGRRTIQVVAGWR